jgi:hypothetical protein
VYRRGDKTDLAKIWQKMERKMGRWQKSPLEDHCHNWLYLLALWNRIRIAGTSKSHFQCCTFGRSVTSPALALAGFL